MNKQLMRKPIALFASGTNVGRVAKAAKKADIYITVPYALKEEKDSSTVIRRLACMSLPNVDWDGNFINDGFSWGKVFKDVHKASAPLKQVFQGLYGCGEENTSFQLSALKDSGSETSINNEFTCVMHWMPQGVLQLDKLKKLVEQWVPNSIVMVLSGNHTCNREAEEEVKQVVAQAKLSRKRVIILSNQMGSRSFSISEVEVCIFMFDRGDLGATEQKAARCLTPGKRIDGSDKKVGWIVSLSVDSNRSEVFTEMTLIEAQRIAKVKNIDFISALKSVLLTMNIFLEKYGVGTGLYQEKDIDQVIKSLRDSEKLIRIANATINVETMDVSELEQLLLQVDPTVREGTFIDTLLPAVQAQIILEASSETTPTRSTDLMRRLKDLQEKIETLNSSAKDVGTLAEFAGSTYVECLDAFKPEDEIAFERIYKVSVGTVRTIIEMGVLPIQILDMIVHLEGVYSVDDFWS